MTFFEPTKSHPVVLEVQQPTLGSLDFLLTLTDRSGNTGSGTFSLDYQRRLATGETWHSFLSSYLNKEPGANAVAAFGRDLFRALIQESPQLQAAWSGARGAAGPTKPLAVTLELGRHTEPFAFLPLELLAEDQGFLFSRPKAALRRAYQATPELAFELPKAPRILFAWACPPGSGSSFDPNPHGDALERIFGEDSVHRIDQASVQSIQEALATAQVEGRGFDYLYLQAHGYREMLTGGICLSTLKGDLDRVSAQSLGQALAGQGLRLAFLCSCKTSFDGGDAFSGVGQQLLAPQGGNLPCVVATQANLPIAGSAELMELFFHSLADQGDPATALAKARREAFGTGGRAWSVPILLSRPGRQAPLLRSHHELAALPTRRAAYLRRPESEAELAATLASNRFVSLVGLPGIGKTELGKEVARAVLKNGLVERVIYREIHVGLDADQLRLLLGTDLGTLELKTDEDLAAVFEAQRESILLVLDNAEDLMRTDAGQAAFREQIDTLLSRTSRLRILLTTRWPVGSTAETERLVDVAPLTREQTSELLRLELQELGVFEEGWSETEEWQGLLGLIDGHPRSLWLISRHFSDGRLGLAAVRDRLISLKEEAILAPDLLGRKDAFEALEEDKKARLRSLVASMDLSFQVLSERHPEAVEAFVALSLFPAGLPENVAQEVTGGEGSLVLDRLYHYHLVQWSQGRTFYPVPLHWYARRRREVAEIDENLCWARAAKGFADFAESCDKMITDGADLEGIDRLLTEQKTLEDLARCRLSSFSLKPRSQAPLARIAQAARNCLIRADQLELLICLATLGLGQARIVKDRVGEANCLKVLGDVNRLRAELEESRRAFDTAFSIYKAIGHRLGEANCLDGLGNLHLRLSEADNARTAFASALPIFQEISDRRGEANCLQSLGNLQSRHFEFEEARVTFENALLIFQEINDRLGEANCLQGLGDLHLRLDEFDEARSAFEKALRIYREIHSRLGEANCLKCLGDLLLRIDEFDEARSAFESALPIYRKIQDRLGEANCILRVGTLHVQLSEFDEAGLAFRKGLFIYRAIRESLGEANCLKCLGDLHTRLSEFDEAGLAFKKGLFIYRAIGDPLGEANCLQSLGNLHTRFSEFDEARSALNKALAIYGKINQRPEEANCLQALGRIELQGGRLPEAFDTYRRLLELHEENKDISGIQSCFSYLALTTLEAGARDQALVLSETALDLARGTSDRFSQTIALDIQIAALRALEQIPSAYGAMCVYQRLGEELNQPQVAEKYQWSLEQVLHYAPDEVKKEIFRKGEAFRAQGVAEAAERLREAGHDPMVFRQVEPEG